MRKWNESENLEEEAALLLDLVCPLLELILLGSFELFQEHSEANFKARCDLLNNWPPQRLIGSVMNCAILVGACLIQTFLPSFLPKYIWTCCICVSGSTFVLLFLLHCLLAACVYNLDSPTFASMVSLTSHIHSSPTLVWLMRLLPSPGPQPSLFNCAFLHLVHHNDGSLVSSFTVYGNKRRDWWPITQSYKLQFAFNYYLN
jgi:hypothetical protein